MKAVLAILLCVSAIALGQDCGPTIQQYYTCISNAAAAGRGKASSVPLATVEKQISNCFIQASCKDPLAKTIDVSDADYNAMSEALASCAEKLNTENVKPMIEQCIAATAKLTGYRFQQDTADQNDASGDKLMSVAFSVYDENYCTNDAARTAAAACLEQVGATVFPLPDAVECKKNKFSKSLAFEKQRFDVVKNYDHCYNNMSAVCRQVFDDLPHTTCECATKLFPTVPQDLAKKLSACVIGTVGAAVAGRLGTQLTESIAENANSIGNGFCPIVLNGTVSSQADPSTSD